MLNAIKNLKKSRTERKVKANLAKVKNPKAIKEDRQIAIDYFVSLGDAATAVPALLARFNYSIEHGINDTREKESALKGIIGYGAEAIPYLSEQLKNTTRIAWPIKALKELGEEQQVVEILKSALVYEDISFDQAQVDKNYDILCYLVDYQLPEEIEKVASFLNDHDERVRYACAEVLIEQKEDSVPQRLERFITDNSAENTRLRQIVIEGFVKNQWKVSNPGSLENAYIANGVILSKENTLIKPS